MKKIFSASWFSALGAQKSCAPKHVVFEFWKNAEAKLRATKKKSAEIVQNYVTARNINFVSAQNDGNIIAFYVHEHEIKYISACFRLPIKFQKIQNEYIF